MHTKAKIVVSLNGLLVMIATGVAFWVRPLPDYDYRMGWDALNKGEWTRVSQCISRLRQSDQHANHVRLLRGGLLLRIGDAKGALVELARVRADGELRERALLLSIEAWYVQKRWTEAAQVAHELLRQNAEHPEAHRWLGAIAYDLGAMDLAETHLQAVARLLPTEYAAYRLMGLMHNDFELYKEAIADYRAALERQPPPGVVVELRSGLAKAQAKQNDFAAALDTLTELSDAEFNAELLALRAACLWNLDRKDEARRSLARGKAADPDAEEVLLQDARFAIDEDRTEDAIAALRRILKADPHHALARYDLALALRRLGRTNEADTEMARRNESQDLFERMVNLNKRAFYEPTNAALRDELATVCEQLGKKELAAMWRDAARALTPQK